MNAQYINDPDAIVWATYYAEEEEFHFCLDRGDDPNVQDEYVRQILRNGATGEHKIQS